MSGILGTIDTYDRGTAGTTPPPGDYPNDGVLIPVRYLITGDSIVQEQQDAVTYWHVQLDRHDVILAEGLPCESFLDTGNRSAFENGRKVCLPPAAVSAL